MTVIVWTVEGTWPACGDAARTHTPADAQVSSSSASAWAISAVRTRSHVPSRAHIRSRL